MKRKVLKLILVLAGILALYCGTIFYKIYSTGKTDRAGKADAIAVLGAAEYGGKPSPVFAARLDHAYELFQNGLAPLIITTGGKYPGEKYSEGEAGKLYLEKKGAPEGAVIAETDSLTTKQNVTRIADIARTKNLRTIVIVSDPFHMYRAALIARDLNLVILPSPAPESPISQKPWLELQFMLRETLLTLLHQLFDA